MLRLTFLLLATVVSERVDDSSLVQAKVRTLELQAPGSDLEAQASGNASFLKHFSQHCAVLRRSYLQSEACGHTGSQPASGFLVTGTGRSGTKFLVQVLNALGLQVSHDTAMQRSRDGAVSWVHGNHKRGCDLPWWSYNVSESLFREVFLMLREPLTQISSRSENGGLERREWYDFLSCSSNMAGDEASFSSTLEWQDDVLRSLDTALKFYVLQNSFIEEYAQRSFRVEQLRDEPQIVVDLCSRNRSCDCSLAKVKQVMNEVGDSVHSNHTDKTPNVTWARLAKLNRPFTAMAQSLAQRHGYLLAEEDVLPETAFGFSCGFDAPDEQSSRWACQLNAKGLLREDFSLLKLVKAKDAQRNCHLQAEQLKRSVVALSVDMAGSDTLSQHLSSAHCLCDASQVYATGAQHVVVPLRHPLARLAAGYQLGKVSDFGELNHFIDALRNSSHEMHPTAMDWAYRPGGANFLLPVTQFYLHDGGTPSSERLRRVMSFVCRCRMMEDLQQIGQKLKLTSSNFTGITSEPDDLDQTLLSEANHVWFLAQYAADLVLYQEHCSACEE